MEKNNPEEEKQEQNIISSEEEENLFNEKNENELNDELKLSIGTFDEAPKYIQDNEYIKGGYLLNCTDFKKALRSLFMCHNETINTWSHLLGALFFFFLIFYISIFINNYTSQLNKIKNDLAIIQDKAEYLYKENPNIMNNTYYSLKEVIKSFNNIEKNNFYDDTLSSILYLCSEIKNITTNTIDYISSSFMKSVSLIKEKIFLIKKQIFNLIKLDTSKTEYLESKLDDKFNIDLEKRKAKELAKWPLFIIVHSAILCFIFSASFHSMGVINERHFDILNRFDYGGISLLISGSCYPPYYYFFYYSNTFKYIYLTIITVFGIAIFLYSLTDDFNKPQKRVLRGNIFLIFGLITGIPVLHMAFFGKYIEGYDSGIKLINWYLGGISYVVGALFYILRFPEKLFPGKFDYIGASHQIFHILVFFGALFHFLGSIDAYNYRFNNLKI